MKYLAPGKIVAWGEYAVLAGASAAVMAINRYATCTLEAHDSRWSFSSRGLLTPGINKFQPSFSHAACALMAEQILQSWGYAELPKPFSLQTDSQGFFQHANKLGLGSSAAVCCATYLALAEFLQRKPDVQEAVRIHQQFQGGKGSGLDVAASFHGGVIRFQDANVRTQAWPSSWHWQAIFTGQSTHTPSALGGFSNWRSQGDHPELDNLCALSNDLCSQPSLPGLVRYVNALDELDAAADLNIFTPAHQRLVTIAAEVGVIYKPCGAGGGDVGLAVTEDPVALEHFCQRASQEQFLPLDLEIAEHGVQAG